MFRRPYYRFRSLKGIITKFQKWLRSEKRKHIAKIVPELSNQELSESIAIVFLRIEKLVRDIDGLKQDRRIEGKFTDYVDAMAGQLATLRGELDATEPLVKECWSSFLRLKPDVDKLVHSVRDTSIAKQCQALEAKTEGIGLIAATCEVQLLALKRSLEFIEVRVAKLEAVVTEMGKKFGGDGYWQEP